MTERKVKPRHTNYGDGPISDWHRRALGYDMPAVDVDKLLIEYESALPAAVIDFKFWNVKRLEPFSASNKALRELCAARSYELPFFIVKYAPDCASFLTYSMNPAARKFVGGSPGSYAAMNSQEFIQFQQELREFQKQRRAS